MMPTPYNEYDPCFEIKEPDVDFEGIYQVHWGKLYKLLSLKGVGNTVSLPGTYFLYEPKEISAKTDVIVFGERTSGLKLFINWHTGHLNRRRKDWVFINANRWNKRFVEKSKGLFDSVDVPSDLFIDEVMDWLLGLDTLEETAKCLERLLAWTSKLKRDFWVIFYELSALPEKKASENIGHVLRLLREAKEGKYLHVLIANSRDELFWDNDNFSGYLNLCDCYRVPKLHKQEATALLFRTLGDVEVDEPALAEMLDITGGQPYLFQLFLQYLKSPLFRDKPIGSDILQRVFMIMKKEPPAASLYWKHELEQILKKRPELVGPMQAYISGQTLSKFRYPPPAVERALAMAGWVGESHTKRWGICSELHAYLGRRVLN